MMIKKYVKIFMFFVFVLAVSSVCVSRKAQATEAKSQPKDWKTLYINEIERLDKVSKGEFTYTLFKLDNDKIPELFCMGKTTASGIEVCSYASGELQIMSVTRGSSYSYVKGKKKLYITGDSGTFGFKNVYKMEKGKIKACFASGYYKDGKTVYYCGNGIGKTKNVSKNTYKRKVAKAFHTKKKKTKLKKFISADKIISKIESYK